MREISHEREHGGQREALEAAWRLLNLQAGTMLKWLQTGTERRQTNAALVSAAAALATACVALGTAFGWVLSRGLHP